MEEVSRLRRETEFLQKVMKGCLHLLSDSGVRVWRPDVEGLFDAKVVLLEEGDILETGATGRL